MATVNITLLNAVRLPEVTAANTTLNVEESLAYALEARGDCVINTPRIEPVPVMSVANPVTGGSGFLSAGNAPAAAPLTSKQFRRPAGFDWEPPIKIYGSRGRIYTDYDRQMFMAHTSAVMYVDVAAGNDTTGNGTLATPYRSIKKAITSMTQPTTIYVKAGFYNRLNGWDSTSSPQQDCNVIAYGGRVTSSVRWEGGAWTDVGNNTYRGTRSSASEVIDFSVVDSDGVAVRMIAAADQAACEATPGSYYIDGTYVFAHLIDNRAPDSNVAVMMAVTNGLMSHDKIVYVSGVTFEGGMSGAFTTATANFTANTRLVLDNCELIYSIGNGIAANGYGLAVMHKCSAYGNLLDGFNYHTGANGISTKVVEIDCASYRNGVNDGVHNDNASSIHGGCRAVRVNCTGGKTWGPTYPDIGTSMSWNIGCVDTGSLAPAGFNTGFRTQDTAKQWLDNCISYGATTADATGTSVQYQRESWLPGSAAAIF